MRIITPENAAFSPDAGTVPLATVGHYALDWDITVDVAVGPVTLVAACPFGVYLLSAAIDSHNPGGTAATGVLDFNVNYIDPSGTPNVVAITIPCDVEVGDSDSVAACVAEGTDITYDYNVTGFTTGVCPSRMRFSAIRIA